MSIYIYFGYQKSDDFIGMLAAMRKNYANLFFTTSIILEAQS